MTRQAKTLVAIMAWLVCAGRGLAQDGLRGALAESVELSFGSNRGLAGLVAQRSLAAADFDNDHQPDAAILINGAHIRNRTFAIRIHLTAGTNQELTFESNETVLALTSEDVNQDGAADLIVEEPLTHRRILVWLNDGHGSFRPASIRERGSGREPADHEAQAPGFSAHDQLASLNCDSENQQALRSSRSRRAPAAIECGAWSPNFEGESVAAPAQLPSRAPPALSI